MNRRRFLRLLGLASGIGTSIIPMVYARPQKPMPVSTFIQRRIPSSRENVPAIGMGTWLTFDVEDDMEALQQRVEVLRNFFELGGTVIDSSPMYGSSQEVLGYCFKRLKQIPKLFAATKVWTNFKSTGRKQIKQAQQFWGIKRFDLMQIHNMLNWKEHLDTLREYKTEGKIRYIGITTSHGRRHDELIKVLKKEKFDFVQFTYNVLDREAEHYLLPLAKERGIAVIINRPFQGGALFSKFSNSPLPHWAAEIGCENWAQFFLKFIISYPAVTCAIPATSRVDHMTENMGACYGALPDVKLRKKMIEYVRTL